MVRLHAGWALLAGIVAKQLQQAPHMMQNPEGMGNEKMGDGDEDSSDVETKKKGTGVVQPNMAINYQKVSIFRHFMAII